MIENWQHEWKELWLENSREEFWDPAWESKGSTKTLQECKEKYNVKGTSNKPKQEWIAKLGYLLTQIETEKIEDIFFREMKDLDNKEDSTHLDLKNKAKHNMQKKKEKVEQNIKKQKIRKKKKKESMK